MTLRRTIEYEDGSYTIELLHRSAGMVAQIRHNAKGEYVSQTVYTGLSGIESLEQWDELNND